MHTINNITYISTTSVNTTEQRKKTRAFSNLLWHSAKNVCLLSYTYLSVYNRNRLGSDDNNYILVGIVKKPHTTTTSSKRRHAAMTSISCDVIFLFIYSSVEQPRPTPRDWTTAFHRKIIVK